MNMLPKISRIQTIVALVVALVFPAYADTRTRSKPGWNLFSLSNQSPAGGRETDWVVAALDQDGLLHYFVGVAPSTDFSRYNRAFDDILDTVRFK